MSKTGLGPGTTSAFLAPAAAALMLWTGEEVFPSFCWGARCVTALGVSRAMDTDGTCGRVLSLAKCVR